MKTSESSSEEKSVVIEPLNKKGLANVLGVSPYILNKMIEACLDELGEPIGTMYCQKQVQYMINKYGIIPKVKSQQNSANENESDE